MITTTIRFIFLLFMLESTFVSTCDAQFTDNKVAKIIEKIRAAGDPVSLADLKPKEIKEDENAATYLNRVADDGVKLYNEVAPFCHSEDFSWRTKMTDEQIDAARVLFEANSKIFQAFDKAATCSEYASPLDYTVSPDEFTAALLFPVQARRNMGRLLDCRGRYLASIGKPDEAAMDYIRLLQLSRFQDREPLLISFLVGIALRGIAVGSLNAVIQTSQLKQETFAAIEKELAEHDSMDHFIDVLKGEVAFGLETFRDNAGERGIASKDCRNYLSYMQKQVDAGAGPHFKVGVIDAPRGGLAAGIVPAIQASREAMNRVRTTLRCVRIVNAIHWRTMQLEGIKFSDLDLPPEIGIDPYSGNNLIIRRDEDGWTVYGRGRDDADDGGVIQDSITDVGVGPPE